MATAQEEFIVNGIYNEWLKKSVDLINESYGLTFPDQTLLKLNFVNEKILLNKRQIPASHAYCADYGRYDARVGR